METAARIMKQDIRVMVYDSYTYSEPMSITFTAPESLCTILYNTIHHGCKKEHGSQHEAKILDLDVDLLSRNVQ